MRIKIISAALALAFLLAVTGCAGQPEYKPIPFKTASAYPGHVSTDEFDVAARIWTDPARAKEDFGFDILAADVTPVQVIVDNKSSSALWVSPSQTRIEDADGLLWDLLPDSVTVDRVHKQSMPGRVGKKAGKGALVGSAAGALLGAAFGIITGYNFGDALFSGAVGGAAVGAVAGGLDGADDKEGRGNTAQALKEQGLGVKMFQAGDVNHGVLYFPGEIKDPRILRLALAESTSGPGPGGQVEADPGQRRIGIVRSLETGRNQAGNQKDRALTGSD